MACTLQVLQHHDAHEVADMERVGSRVDTHVCRCHFFVELFFCAGHHIVDHPAPFEFFYEINFTHRNLIFCIVVLLLYNLQLKYKGTTFF